MTLVRNRSHLLGAIITLALAILLVGTVVGCGGKSGTGESSEGTGPKTASTAPGTSAQGNLTEGSKVRLLLFTQPG